MNSSRVFNVSAPSHQRFAPALAEAASRRQAEAFTTGSPMSVCYGFCNIWVIVSGSVVFIPQGFQYASEVPNAPAGHGLRVGIEIEDLNGDLAVVPVFDQRL